MINTLDCVFISECKNYKSLTDYTRKLNNSANQTTAKIDLGDHPLRSDSPVNK